jgi:hypothetical protein
MSAIQGKGTSGNAVLNSQPLATSKGFGNVSKIWYDKCIPFDKGMEKIANDQQKIRDYSDSPLGEWEPAIDSKDRFILRHKINREEYIPTDHTLQHIATCAGVSTTFLKQMREPKLHPIKKTMEYSRDRRDAEVVVQVLKNTLFAPDRVDQEKPRLFRTWTDGTMRAMLSSKYAIVNNSWVLESLQKLIPGGMLSHWRGDADSIYGNILIPDTIREEKDSDYGGMLSIGNSEIGTRRISSQPSVFRAICMNGCIWDQESGIAIRQKHMGNIDLEDLFGKIKHNLEKQIPLLDIGIQRMLGIKAYGVGDTPILNLFAQTAQDYSISSKQIQGVMRSFVDEQNVIGKEVFSAFGLQAAITRFGQTQDDDEWVRLDEVAGSIVNLTTSQWDAMLNRARHISVKAIESLVGQAA